MENGFTEPFYCKAGLKKYTLLVKIMLCIGRLALLTRLTGVTRRIHKICLKIYVFIFFLFSLDNALKKDTEKCSAPPRKYVYF